MIPLHDRMLALVFSEYVRAVGVEREALGEMLDWLLEERRK